MVIALMALSFVLIAMLAGILAVLIVERRNASIDAENTMAELAVDTMRITGLEHRVEALEQSERNKQRPARDHRSRNGPLRKKRYRRRRRRR